MAQGLIYSANIGGYDVKRDFAHREAGIDYRMAENLETKDPRFRARNAKVMAPHLWPGYDWYLWLDATMEIKQPISSLIDQLIESEHDFAAFRHNEWDCAYREIAACKERGKDTEVNLSKAEKMLKLMKFPKHFGQAATGVLFRKNTKLVHKHALAWWIDMQATTMRDQATFMFNLWGLDAYIEWLPGRHTDNDWFQYHRGHLK